MLSDDYLEMGITALSRAGSLSAMDGHAGAAVLAAYFFCRENQLEPGAAAYLQQVVDASMAKDASGWLGAKKLPQGASLFAPLPPEKANPGLLQDILAVLGLKIDRLQQSGHCPIFASLALKTLSYQPQLCRPALVAGICQLLEKFNGNPGKGYYGKEKGWVAGIPVEPAKHLSPYLGCDDLVKAAFAELIDNDKTKTKGYGSLVHLITHTNALVELDELGYGDLARRGFGAQQTHIMLLRSLPPDLDPKGRQVQLQPAQFSPLSKQYWRSFNGDIAAPSALNLGGAGHALKVSYAFFHLINTIEDSVLKNQYLQELGYLT